MHLDAETRDLAWATVVSLLGLPADPRWGEVILSEARKEKRMRRLEGIGCNPAVVLGTREDLMERIGEARKSGLLAFAKKNGPISLAAFSDEGHAGQCESGGRTQCAGCGMKVLAE